MLCHAGIQQFHKGTDFLHSLAQMHPPSFFTEFPISFSSLLFFFLHAVTLSELMFESPPSLYAQSTYYKNSSS